MDFYACMTTSLKGEDPLREQHEQLKKHYASLKDTVQVLGDQASQTTRVAQQAQDSKLEMISRQSKLQEQLQQVHNSKLELSQRHSDLQVQFDKLKVTSQTLHQNCKALDEKLFLQTQLHADKLRLVDVTQNTLKDRCKAISVSAEQHRIANLRLEERHKSFTKDLELVGLHGSNSQLEISAKNKVIQTLQSTLHAEREGRVIEIASLQSRISSQAGEIQQLTDTAKIEIDSLRSKMESKMESKTESKMEKQLKEKLSVSHALLSHHPIDTRLDTKTKNILLSSAEILELAHSEADCMEQCLGQVAEALRDLDGQLGTRRGLTDAWLDQVKRIF